MADTHVTGLPVDIQWLAKRYIWMIYGSGVTLDSAFVRLPRALIGQFLAHILAHTYIHTYTDCLACVVSSCHCWCLEHCNSTVEVICLLYLFVDDLIYRHCVWVRIPVFPEKLISVVSETPPVNVSVLLGSRVCIMSNILEPQNYMWTVNSCVEDMFTLYVTSVYRTIPWSMIIMAT